METHGTEAQSNPEVSTLSTPTDTEVHYQRQKKKQSSLWRSLCEKEGSDMESCHSCPCFQPVAFEKLLTLELMNVTKIIWQYYDWNNCTITTIAFWPKGKKTTEGSQLGSRWVLF